ncbi:hypothetical protein JTB14_030526 [Gonioctena quinquepunctata]|nr:hypothetical protein JTB14_030526 [Gonioctena quinquepunctata]
MMETIDIRFPETTDLRQNTDGHVDYIINSTKTTSRNTIVADHTRALYVVPWGQNTQDRRELSNLYEHLKKLREIMEVNHTKQILVLMNGGAGDGTLRKVLEYVFHGTGISAEMMDDIHPDAKRKPPD